MNTYAIGFLERKVKDLNNDYFMAKLKVSRIIEELEEANKKKDDLKTEIDKLNEAIEKLGEK